MATLKDLTLNLKANTSNLQTNLKKADRSLGNFSAQKKKTAKAVSQGSKQIKGAFTSMGSAVTGQVDAMTGGLGAMSQSVIQAFKGIQMLSKGMNIFKIAMASTGIGLLVVGLGSLVAYFTKTQKGADWLSKAMAGIGAVITTITDTISSFGGAVFEAFSNPKESVKGFGESIGSFVMDKIKLLIKGVKGLGTAFTLLFEGEFKSAAKQAGDSLLDITKATSPVAWGMEAISATVSSVVEKYGEASEKAKQAMQAEKDAQQLRRDRMKFDLLESELLAKKSDLILQSREEEKYSADQRRKFIEEAKALDAQLFAQKIALQEEELRIKQVNDSLGENMIEDDEATVKLQIELNALKKKQSDSARELENRAITLNNKISKQRREQEKINAELEAEKKLKEDLANVATVQKLEPLKQTLTIDKEQASADLQETTNLLGEQIKGVDLEAIQIKIDAEEAKIKKQEFLESYFETVDTIASKTQEIAGIIGQVQNSIAGAFGAVMTKKKTELDNYYNKEKTAIENSGKSEREKAELTRKLEEDITKKKAKLATKQAKMDKAQNIVSAITNGAVAVTKALTLGPILGPIMAGIIGTMAGIQVAAIASTPLPTFSQGGIVGGSSGTGDRQLIRANAGEMILNQASQKSMFDFINSNVKPSGGGKMNHEIKVRGEDLYIALSEYDRKQNNTY